MDCIPVLKERPPTDQIRERVMREGRDDHLRHQSVGLRSVLKKFSPEKSAPGCAQEVC